MMCDVLKVLVTRGSGIGLDLLLVPSFRSVCVSSVFRDKFNNRLTLRLEYSLNFRGSLHSWCCCWSFKLNQLAHWRTGAGACIFNIISRNITIMFICS